MSAYSHKRTWASVRVANALLDVTVPMEDAESHFYGEMLYGKIAQLV